MIRRLNIQSAGFTLIELLAAAAILVVIAGIVISTFSSFQQNMVRDSAVESIVSVFNEARAYTLSAKDGTSYGIHIESDRVVLFSGTVYSAAASSNRIVYLQPGIEIRDIALTGGVQNVLFARQTGNANVTGTFTLWVSSNSLGDVVITVQRTGVLTFAT